MQCPICGKDVEIQKKQAGVDEQGTPVFNEYAVCHACRKQWNLNKQRMKKKAPASDPAEKKAGNTGVKRTEAQKPAGASRQPEQKAVPVKKAAPQQKGTAGKDAAAPVSNRKATERPGAEKAAAGKEAGKARPAVRASTEKPAVKKNAAQEPAAQKEPKRAAAPQKRPVDKEAVRKEAGSESSGEEKKVRRAPSARKPEVGQMERTGKSAPAGERKGAAVRKPAGTPETRKAGAPKAPERKENISAENERTQRKAPEQKRVKGAAPEKRNTTDTAETLQREPARKKEPVQKNAAVEEQRYGNIPSEKVRAKKERAVKQAYEEMLSADSDQAKTKKKKPAEEESIEKKRPVSEPKRPETRTHYEEEYEDDEMEYEEAPAKFRAVRIVFGILSLIAFGFFVYRGFFAGLDNIASGGVTNTGTTYIVFAVCMLISGLILLILQNRSTIFAFVIPMAFYLGGAVFAFLKRGDDSLLLYSAIAGAVLGIVFLVLGVISGNQDEYDDYDDSDDRQDEDDYDDDYADDDEDYDYDDDDDYDDEDYDD